MTRIATHNRLGEPDTRPWLSDEPDWRIGTIGVPLEGENIGWLRGTLRLFRKAVYTAILAVMLAIGAILLLALGVVVLFHLWLVPIEMGWDALSEKRKGGRQPVDHSTMRRRPHGRSISLG